MNIDSRTMVLLCAILMLATASGLATIQSEDYILPLSLLVGGVSILLFYSLLLNKRQLDVDSSTTIAVSSNQGTEMEYSDEIKILPDPNEVGIETPIL